MICLLLIFTPRLLLATYSMGPNNGSMFSNVIASGSVSTWTNPGNSSASDDVYATNTSNLPSNGDHSDYRRVTNFGFDIPSNFVIYGLVVEVERNDITSKAKDYAARIVKNDTIRTTDKSNAAGWGANDSYTSYGGATDLWGEIWTANDINSANFGFAIAIKRSGGGATPITAKIDYIRITIYYTSSGALPVGLISFIAASKNHEASLRWTTATEINNDYFTLEKSRDMVHFTEVCRIKGVGNAQFDVSYAATDSTPYDGLSFYSLRQTDFDGNSEIIGMVKFNFATEEKKRVVSLYPNPIRSSANLAIDNYEGYADIKFTDEKGRMVYTTKLLIEHEGEIKHIEGAGNLPPGFYFLSVKTGDEENIRRIMKSE